MRELRFDLSIQEDAGPRGDRDPDEIRPDGSKRKRILAAAVLALAGAYILEARPIGHAAASAEPGFIDFASAPRLRPTVRSVTIRSTGQSPLRVREVAVRGQGFSEFPIASDKCTNAVLPPGESCSIDVQFLRQGRAEARADLVVSDDAGDAPVVIGLRGESVVPPVSKPVQPPTKEVASPIGVAAPPVSVADSGKGIDRPDLAVDPSPLVFRQTEVGGKETHSILVTPGGKLAARFAKARLSGQDAREFSILEDRCRGRSMSTTVPCRIRLEFKPRKVGDRVAAIQLDAEQGNGVKTLATVEVHGEAVERSALVLAPTSLSFTGGAVTPVPVSQEVTVTKRGAGSVVVGKADLLDGHGWPAYLGQGNPSRDFTAMNQCEGKTLNEGDTCAIQVRFVPHSFGASQAVLAVRASNQSLPVTVTLDGTGPSEPVAWCCVNGVLKSMTESACRSVPGGQYYSRDDPNAQGKCVIIK